MDAVTNGEHTSSHRQYLIVAIPKRIECGGTCSNFWFFTYISVFFVSFLNFIFIQIRLSCPRLTTASLHLISGEDSSLFYCFVLLFVSMNVFLRISLVTAVSAGPNNFRKNLLLTIWRSVLSLQLLSCVCASFSQHQGSPLSESKSHRHTQMGELVALIQSWIQQNIV